MELTEIVCRQRGIYIKQLQSFYKDRTEGAKEILLAYNTEEPVMLLNLSRMDYRSQRNASDLYRADEFQIGLRPNASK
jgi:hypothetical protein